MYRVCISFLGQGANCIKLFSGSVDPQVPPGQGCPTPGCNGVGHIKGPRYGTHYTLVTDIDTLLHIADYLCNDTSCTDILLYKFRTIWINVDKKWTIINLSLSLLRYLHNVDNRGCNTLKWWEYMWCYPRQTWHSSNGAKTKADFK